MNAFERSKGNKYISSVTSQRLQKCESFPNRGGHLGGAGGAAAPPTFYRFLLNYENSHYFLVILSKFMYDKTFSKQPGVETSRYFEGAKTGKLAY